MTVFKYPRKRKTFVLKYKLNSDLGINIEKTYPSWKIKRTKIRETAVILILDCSFIRFEWLFGPSQQTLEFWRHHKIYPNTIRWNFKNFKDLPSCFLCNIEIHTTRTVRKYVECVHARVF